MIDNDLIPGKDIPEPVQRAGRKEWIGLAVLVLPCLLISMDMSVLLFGLPFISADLKPSATQQLWIMDAYGFALAGVLITMGAVGDRIGRRKLLLAGTAAFGAASAVAAYAGSADVLIASRALLGLAGATLMPSTMALIRNMFQDEKQRQKAIAMWTGGIVGGATLGPVVGGLLLDHFWWGSVFLINLPAMALLLILGPILLPEYKAPKSGKRFDYLGSVLSVAAVLPAVYGIKQLAVDGVSAGALAAVAVGVALGIAFLIRQRTAANPLIDTELFRKASFRTPVLVNLFGNFVMIGFSLYNTQYLQSVAGMRPFTAALWSLAVLPAVSIGMAITGTLTTKVRPAKIVGGAFLIAAGGALVLFFAHPGNPIAVLLIGAGTVACGMVAAQTIAGTMVMTAASAERAGSASALNETGSELGSALGMALLGSVGAAIYHHKMSGAVVPGIPAGAVADARQTLGSAVAVADQYPGAASHRLLETARDAYTSGFHYAAIAGAVVLVLTGLYTMRSMRHEPVLPAEPKPDKPAKKAKHTKTAGHIDSGTPADDELIAVRPPVSV